MVGPELRHLGLQRRLDQHHGFGGPSGGQVGQGEVVSAPERVGMVCAEPRFEELEGTLMLADRFLRFAEIVVGAAQGLANGCLDGRLASE